MSDSCMQHVHQRGDGGARSWYGGTMKSTLEWYCRRTLSPLPAGYEISTSFGLGSEHYDHVCRTTILDQEIAQFGGIGSPDFASFLEYKINDIVRSVKEALYEAICRDDVALSSVNAWRRARNAEDRALAAEARADKLSDKAAKYLRIMKEVADGDDGE